MTLRVLPDGWTLCAGGRARQLATVLARDTPPGHRLFGVEVDVVAVHGCAPDDILLNLKEDPSRWLIAHLIGKRVADPTWPHVCFEGDWQALLAFERSNRAEED